MTNVKSFFISWLVILLLNQIFIFHACFAPHCVLAALPHTGIIAFLLTFVVLNEEKKKKEEILKPIINDHIPVSISPNPVSTVDLPIPPKITVRRPLKVKKKIDKPDNQKFDFLKIIPYKEIPVIDETVYNGTILKKYDHNDTIILDIENVGIYKVKLPKRKLWDTLKENNPFSFLREKYFGKGKNSHVVYSKLEIVERKVSNKPKEKCKKENQKSYYGIYHPWHGGHNPEFDAFSGRILDLKSDKSGIVNYFFDLLKDSNFDRADTIVIVPSHDPQKTTSSVKSLAQKLASYKGLSDATNSVKRVRKIAKLAQGGNRDVSVHLKSLTVNEPSLIKGKNVLVFDDVSTTGNSLEATMQLLKNFGAYSVCAYTVAHTG